MNKGGIDKIIQKERIVNDTAILSFTLSLITVLGPAEKVDTILNGGTLGKITEAIGYLIMLTGFSGYLYTRLEDSRIDRFLGTEGTYLPESPELETDGLYGYTRNPMYLFARIATIGSVLANTNALNCVLAILFFISTEYLVRIEEKKLDTLFGKEFEKYKANVHRWIGYTSSGNQTIEKE